MEKLREKQAKERQELETTEKEVRFSEDEDLFDTTEDSTLEIETQTPEKYDIDAGTQTGKNPARLWP